MSTHAFFDVPAATEHDAVELLAASYGITGDVDPLPGERDRNFHVRADDGRQFALKIANAVEERPILELQHAALAHCAHHAPSIVLPRVVPSRSGTGVTSWNSPSGEHLVRLLTWVPGKPLAHTTPHRDFLLESLGESLGALDHALLGFEHPAAVRTLKWDLTQAAWIAPFVERIPDAARRALVTGIVAEFERATLPALRGLRRGVIYGDGNDYNVLTRVGEHEDHLATRVVGFIDFGDMVESHVVCDLAVTLAYAMMSKADPISAAVSVVRGFHRQLPLEEAELAILLPLVRARLAVSVTNSAIELERVPEHAYQQISAAPAWRLLEQLASVSDGYAECRLREACGLEPCPTSVAVRTWLAANRATFARVVEAPLDAPTVPVFDLSVASAQLGTLDEWTNAERFSRRLFSQMRDAGTAVAIGRYDEVRALYTSDVFRVESNEGPDFRAVHIGLDVFAAPGTTVFAPLAGRVHSFRDNANSLDYGPTVILEHDAGGVPFYTLYGHLARHSLEHLRVGDTVGAGAPVAVLGQASENGGWPPHLHFQIVCDLFGRSGDFPGVARARERETWLSVSPDPSLMLHLPATARAPRPAPDEQLLTRRRAHIGRSLSISYRAPLHMVRGARQFLIAADGRRYLDAVNNVPHVGHSHPDVVRAAQRQMGVLNTNTRYLHESLIAYAERLAASLPPPLEVIYFVCSGSEANELAIRLARAHTGERDMVVLKAGYHGNMSTLVEVSSYKFDGKGGSGAPPWVHVAPMPDVYRGPFKRDDAKAGWKYAQAVREAVGAIRREGRRPAAFLCESILSCGGQIVLPDGYLAEAYRHVRDAGGVCIADEVQVGFGRVGTHMWAFETQGVVPDIVTMGKPIGNGHPLGAVATTREIADSFANGMEYFNTFGGNPVSCEVGLAVLDVMAHEGLQRQALDVGSHLLRGLSTLVARHDLVGDVRGLGLFVGAELVTDRHSLEPATRQAGYVANRMRENGILLSTDGPFNNVLKIKPPLCFTTADADLLVETLDRVLGEDGAQP